MNLKHKITVEQADKVWFTSDTHFGHQNIIDFMPKSRPYKDADEMEFHLVQQWNRLVQEDDTVFVLGDMFFRCGVNDCLRIPSTLNGRIFLVPGNHDREYLDQLRDISCVDVLEPIVRLKLSADFAFSNIIMCHFPMISWEGRNKGAIHLHGHTHTKQNNFYDMVNGAFRLDIGWDNFLRPINLRQIEEIHREPFRQVDMWTTINRENNRDNR